MEKKDILLDYLCTTASTSKVSNQQRTVRFALPNEAFKLANFEAVSNYLGAGTSFYYGPEMQSHSMVHEWSSPLKKTVVGSLPPQSNGNVETQRSEMRQSDVRVVTPFYKSSAPLSPLTVPNGQIKSEVTETRNMNGSGGQYKVKQQQEHYRLQMIDPKVESHAHIPVSATLPSSYRRKVGDFPSAHSKRSFIKPTPLEQRRLKSVEIRPITTTDYLTESLRRHRDMVTSPLKDQLKLNERDVNKIWDKPDRPGHKAGDLNGMFYKRWLTTTSTGSTSPSIMTSTSTLATSIRTKSKKSVMFRSPKLLRQLQQRNGGPDSAGGSQGSTTPSSVNASISVPGVAQLTNPRNVQGKIKRYFEQISRFGMKPSPASSPEPLHRYKGHGEKQIDFNKQNVAPPLMSEDTVYVPSGHWEERAVDAPPLPQTNRRPFPEISIPQDTTPQVNTANNRRKMYGERSIGVDSVDHNSVDQNSGHQNSEHQNSEHFAVLPDRPDRSYEPERTSNIRFNESAFVSHGKLYDNTGVTTRKKYRESGLSEESDSQSELVTHYRNSHVTPPPDPVIVTIPRPAIKATGMQKWVVTGNLNRIFPSEEIRSQKDEIYESNGFVPLIASGAATTNSSFTVPFGVEAIVETETNYEGGKIVRKPSVKALKEQYLGEVEDQMKGVTSSEQIERVMVEHNLRLTPRSPSPPEYRGLSRMRPTPPPSDPQTSHPSPQSNRTMGALTVESSYSGNQQTSNLGLNRFSPLPRVLTPALSPHELSVRQRARKYEQLVERHVRSRSEESQLPSRATSPQPTPNSRGHSAPPALRHANKPKPLPTQVFDELRSRDWYSRYMNDRKRMRRGIPRASSENVLHDYAAQQNAQPYIIYGNTAAPRDTHTYDGGLRRSTNNHEYNSASASAYDLSRLRDQTDYRNPRLSAPSFRQQPPVRRKILQKQNNPVGSDQKKLLRSGRNSNRDPQSASNSYADAHSAVALVESDRRMRLPGSEHQNQQDASPSPNRVILESVSRNQPDSAGGVTVALYDSPPAAVSGKAKNSQYAQFEELSLDDGPQIVRYGGKDVSQQQSTYSTLERSYAQQQNRQMNISAASSEMYRSTGELNNRYDGIGRYTQLTMPPEPAVVENEPIRRNVDARPGSVTDFIQTDVRTMRQMYLDDIKPNQTTTVTRNSSPWTPNQNQNHAQPHENDSKRRAMSPNYSHMRALSPATKARMRMDDPRLTEEMLREIQIQREQQRLRSNSTLPYMELNSTPNLERSSSTLPYTQDNQLLKTARGVDRGLSLRENGHSSENPVMVRKSRLPARSSSMKHPPAPDAQIAHQNGLSNWEPLQQRGSPYTPQISEVKGNYPATPHPRFDPVLQYKEEKHIEKRMRDERSSQLQYEQRQQTLMEQYKREERERQERKMWEQEQIMLKNKRQEEVNRSFWDNERRQHVLKQQEMQANAQEVADLKLQQHRKSTSALHTFQQNIPPAPPARTAPTPPPGGPPPLPPSMQPFQIQHNQVQHNQVQHNQLQHSQDQYNQVMTLQQQNQYQQDSSGTWRRTYQVTSHGEDVIKNQIKSSEEILEEEAYYVDLMARRDAFIEKDARPPPILRLNKVWQPPPDKPLLIPTPKGKHKTFYEEEDDKRHYWEPHLTDPDFKYERKNYTPEPSPPPRRRSMRGSQQNLAAPQPQRQNHGHGHHHQEAGVRGHAGGADSLDVRMRVIRPSSVTPSEASSAALHYSSQPQLSSHIDIPVPTGQLANEPTHRHSSTVTGIDRPLNVNIRGRMAAFEHSQRSPGRMYPTGSLTRPSAPSSISLDEEMFALADSRAVRFADRSGMGRNSQPLHLQLGDHHMQYTNQSRPTAFQFQRYKKKWSSEIVLSFANEEEIPTVSVAPQRNEDLNSLTTLREELAARAKDRADYKLTISDIQKMNAELEQHNKEDTATNRDSFVESTTTTSSTHMHKVPSSAGDATDSTTWQFSTHSFSPRSVISVNGHKDDSGLLHVRTDLASPMHQQTNNTQQQWRYNSMPLLSADAGHSTLIKVQDERHKTPAPRSIMKQSQGWQVEKEAPRTTTTITRTPMSENIQKVEETVRTEEIERRVLKKERRSKSKSEHKRHRRSERGDHHYSYGGGMIDDGTYASNGLLGQSLNTGGSLISLLTDVITEKTANSPLNSPASKLQKMSNLSSSNGFLHRVNGHNEKMNGYTRSQSDITTKHPLENKMHNFESSEGVTHDGFHYTSQSHHSAWRRPAAITQNGSGYYGPSTDEGYQRHTSTRRIKEGSSRDSRNPSLNDSIRRREFKYSENGDIRPRHQNTQNSRVHKSQSSRDVYHNGHGEDYYWGDGHYGTGGPIVEYPPTLPRDPTYGSVARNSMHKSRSFADWEDPRWRDAQLVRKWDNDMTQLERDFRDSLLMPVPNGGQNMDQREYRSENLPDGGHETLSKQVKANSGRRYDARNVTDFNEGKQEFHYKKEKGFDTRRR